MQTFQHLTWSAKSQLSWLDGKTKQRFDKTLDSKVEVWVGQDSTFYRIEMPIISESNELEKRKEEIELRKSCAIFQDYDCRDPGLNGNWEVCNINVIPAFGDTRTSDVNYLQFPMNELATRLMLLGKTPTVWNELKFEIGPGKFELSTWDQVNNRGKLKSQPAMWTLYRGTFSEHMLSKISITNGFDSSPLRSIRDIKFMGDQIVGFTRTDDTIQAENLLLPKSVTKFELMKEDSGVPDISFKKGADVFDFRLCPPVALNQFPNLDCKPKTYKWGSETADMKSLTRLMEAGFNTPPPPKSNGVSPLFVGIGIVAVVVFAGSFWKLKRK